MDEKEQRYLAYRRATEEPLRLAAEKSRDYETQFSQSAIKSILLLNGGALIAFPVFARIVETDIANNEFIFLGGILAFVLGLFMAAVTYLLGCFSFRKDKEAVLDDTAVRLTDLDEAFGRLTDANALARERASRNMIDLRDERDRLMKWAVGAGIGSGVLFLIGTVLAFLLMLLY